MDTQETTPLTQDVAGVSNTVEHDHIVGTSSKSEKEHRKKRNPARIGKKSPVTELQVSALVWQKALEASEGDVRRIQIISTKEVIVHNHPRSWK